MNKRGFTLIELMMSMFIGLLILGGMVTFFVSQSRTYTAHTIQIDTLQEARSVMRILLTDIRLAGYKKYGASFNGIAAATDKSIRILADLDQDGLTTGSNEDITITYNPNTAILTRNSDVLCENASNMSFSYMLADGSVTSAPTDLTQIREITLNLSIRSRLIDPTTMTYKVFDLNSNITPRNLAYGG